MEEVIEVKTGEKEDRQFFMIQPVSFLPLYNSKTPLKEGIL